VVSTCILLGVDAWSGQKKEQLKSLQYLWLYKEPGAHFLKAPETFRARKAIFNSSVSKKSELYMPETSCLRGTSFHIENMQIKQLCYHKIFDFAMAFWVRKLFETFEKRAPGALHSNILTYNTALWHQFNHFKQYF